MSGQAGSAAAPVHLRLPATSANLGPGFDAAGVALEFALEIEAEAADQFSILAAGWNADLCMKLEGNLILDTYSALLTEQGRPVTPLAIRMRNGIPLGMGCGSSAAGLLGAVALANHFGALGWASEQILEEACAQEGHPDNVVPCWMGGFVSAVCEDRSVHFARVVPPAEWRAIVVVPAEPLPTSRARAVLPASYSRADAVANIQSATLLGLAFAQGRGDLLRLAMRDRIHQPYRAAICPLLERILPLAGTQGILGAALSGAGPSVLAIVAREADLPQATAAIQEALAPDRKATLLVSRLAGEGAACLVGATSLQ
jgi:homoserine kinase